MDRGRHSRATHTVVTAYQVWQEAVRSGIAEPELRALTGLDPAGLTDFTSRLPAAQLFAVWAAVIRRLDDPAFPLRVADGAARDARSAVFYLAAACATVREAILRSVDCATSWTTAYTLSARSTPGGGLAIVLDGLDPGDLGARCEAEFQLADFITGIRTELQPGYTPLHVRFAHRAPPDARAHHAWFGPGLEFGAPRTEVVYDPAMLDRPIGTARPGLADVLAKHLADLRMTDAPPSYRDRAWQWLAAHTGDRATVAVAARALAISERTLHRRLAEEGTSFRELNDEVRHELAVHLVRTTSRPVREIATTVGFADPRSFQRAYSRWTGTTPGRDRQLQDPQLQDPQLQDKVPARNA